MSKRAVEQEQEVITTGVDLVELFEEFNLLGYIECRKCGSALELDAPACSECGWVNPVFAEGMI